LRRIAAGFQAAIIIGLPFIRMNGESALRFDVPSLRLYFFGSVLWISEAYLFLLVTLLFLIAVMLFTVLYGRIWCGWMCPQTVLSDFARMMQRLFASRGLAPRLATHLLLVFLSVFIAANLIWYFVSPYDMLRNIVRFSLGPWTLGSWVLFSVLAYLNLAFVRQKFCTTVCPYARLQSGFFDDRTLTITFDRARQDECRGCEACVRACPAGIDIRQGLQIECINCAECIDACTGKLSRFKRPPLVGYFFGIDRTGVLSRRPRVIWLSLLCAVIAGLFAYQIAVRVPVGFWVLNTTYRDLATAGQSPSGLNSYAVTIENRSLRPADYRLLIAPSDTGELLIAWNPFPVPANASMTFTVYIRSRPTFSTSSGAVQFILEDTERPEIRITRTASLLAR
jgi:cytochrome c oxidase accessory protein FixG